MEELLASLEKRLKWLLEEYRLVKQTNQQLTQAQSKALSHRTSLLTNHTAAIHKIQHLIAKLKALEESYE